MLRCNYCILEHMKKDAISRGMYIVTANNTKGGVDVYRVAAENGVPTKEDWICWFMGLPVHCCC